MSERGFRRLVLVLLVANIFLVGVVGGGGYAWYRQTYRIGPGTGLLRAAALTLDKAKRGALRDAVLEARRASRPQVQDVQQARLELARVLAEPAPEAAALQAALARLRVAEAALREQLEGRVAEVLVGFPRQQRTGIASAIMPAQRARPQTNPVP
jgi:uncharacterized membrane protein